MNPLLIVTLILSTLTLGRDHEVNLRGQIIGHWTSISTGDSLLTVDDFIKSGKEIRFKKINYQEKKYHWGGGCYNGIEFTENNTFNFYNNTLCSTETSPISNSNETWEIKENLITITGTSRLFDIQVVSVSKKELVVVFKNH